jgi:hypothetical protein
MYTNINIYKQINIHIYKHKFEMVGLDSNWPYRLIYIYNLYR